MTGGGPGLVYENEAEAVPSVPEVPGASALEMAKAILGSGIRVVGASFSGNRDVSGLGADGSAVLSTGASQDAPSAHIDIDFIPETDHLGLSMALVADEVPISGGERLLSDGVTIWINGHRQAMRPAQVSRRAEGQADGHVPVAATADAGLRIGMGAVLGVWKSRVNSIRIATRTLGAAAVLSALAVRAEANNGQAVGNPSNGNGGNDSPRGNADNGNGNGGGGGGGGGANNFTAVDDTVDIWEDASVTVDLRANDVGPGQSVIFITEINGQAVEVGDTVDIGNGETVTLNADGTVTITADDSGVIQGTFDYTAAYGTGNARQLDTAVVTLNTVPCFVAGTLIRTPDGPRAVESLGVGDMVVTRDDGPQPIRWIGRRTMAAEGAMAPVEIARGVFGDHDRIRVSPLHRILVRNTHAELLFGSAEVLIAARDLIDGRKVRQIEGGTVDYVHILFDRHQVVWSNGLLSESFLPGPQTAECFEREVIEEICAIFPELDPETGEGYGPAARPTLKSFEAKLLSA
ncbi:hypothetical protein GQ651_16155 [Alphaproteobacteria bacterium GH1-50]|uniref:Hedgehog/Intein (Hint) domain-containing protein n=1 Tax=Kangsaoukella pontilimi TaxID=2691042 RepID=A0A7C9MXV9_9RHOB|nr:Hint domain-containing protein [Kangsaoukella pontilimi]MXQ09380.1 hypothetical protein [Kangsaoukella pontilimi]